MLHDEYVKIWNQCMYISGRISLITAKSWQYSKRINALFGYLEPLNTASTPIMSIDEGPYVLNPLTKYPSGFFAYTDIRRKYGWNDGEIGSEVNYSDSWFVNWCKVPELRELVCNAINPTKHKKMFKLMVCQSKLITLTDGNFENAEHEIKISRYSPTSISRGKTQSYLGSMEITKMFPNYDILKLQSFLRKSFNETRANENKNEGIFRVMENTVAVEMMALGIKPRRRN